MTAGCSTHPRYIDNGYVQLVSVIGNGAYGVVFYALDYRYGRPIKRAVKQLRRHGIDERQRRFQLREISLHRRASRHPSIIHMDRLIEEPDCVYVVMDYGDEGDLFAMITEKQRVSHHSLVTISQHASPHHPQPPRTHTAHRRDRQWFLRRC